jgi:hypothetical protein
VEDNQKRRKDWLGVLRRKKRPTDVSELDIPKTSSAGSLENKKPRTYFALAGSFMGYGSAKVAGQDTIKVDDSSGGSESLEQISTYQGNITYQSSGNASFRWGTQRPFFGGARFPTFYRVELDISYYRMRGQLGPLSKSDDYPSVEPIPPGYPPNPTWTPVNNGTWYSNLITVGANGYFDLAKVGPGYPYVGGGAAVGINFYDGGYLQTAPVVLFNVFAGYFLNIAGKFSMSIGYKLTILLPATYTLGFDGAISGTGDNPAAVTQVMGIGTTLLQQVEVVLFIF